MPISDTKFETVSVRIQPHADFYRMVSLFVSTMMGDVNYTRRRVDFVQSQGDVAVFRVEVDGEHDEIEPLLAQWHADNKNSIVEIW